VISSSRVILWATISPRLKAMTVRLRRVTLAGVALFVAGCGGGHTALAPSNTIAGSEPVSRVLADMQLSLSGTRGVHVVVRAVHGQQTVLITQDSVAGGGRQDFTFAGHHATVLVLNGKAFREGDVGSLTDLFNFPGAIAERAAHRWIGYTQQDSGYAQVVAGVSIQAVMAEIAEADPVLQPPDPTRPSERVLRGIATSPDYPPNSVEYLTVTTDPGHLPIRVMVRATGGDTVSASFSDWGERPVLSKPSRWTPVAAVISQGPTT
jgi:hypothetical protein